MQTPLEALVSSQLRAIRKQATALHERLQMSISRDTTDVAWELWKLQTSADRLDRMIDAMASIQTAYNAVPPVYR
jgi:hypothetical protein